MQVKFTGYRNFEPVWPVYSSLQLFYHKRCLGIEIFTFYIAKLY